MLGIHKKLLVRFSFFVLVATLTCNMGDKEKSTLASEPGFASLAEGEGSFRAVIYDERNQYMLKDFSFFGHTSVGGVRRETDDSVTKIEISKIRELKVLKPHFDSKRFGDKDFLLAEITSATGAVTSDLLIPKKVIICGVDEKSGLEKSWFLHKISKVAVQGASHVVLPSIPSAIIAGKKDTIPLPLPLTQAHDASPTHAPVQQGPTAGSSEATKRTHRPATANKWDTFYQENQLPEQKVTEPKKGVLGAFVAIIDAIIDFIKALIQGAVKLVQMLF